MAAKQRQLFHSELILVSQFELLFLPLVFPSLICSDLDNDL